MEHLEDYFELEGYGVKLRRLTHDKIELLRQWRNDPKIQQTMFYRTEITPEMQEKWFANLDKKRNFYFFIIYRDKEVGCINIRDINWETKSGEPGLFIYDDEYLNSDVAMRASFCLNDWIWNILELDIQHIEVVKSNKRALEYNIQLGCIEVPAIDGDSNDKVRFILTKENALKPNKFLDSLRIIFNITK